MTTVRPDFAIMAAGFKSGSLVHMSYYEEPVTPIAIPSLHIYGESDEIIPTELSEALAECFVEPKILKHSGGHYFAATTAQRPVYVETFQDMLQHHLEAKEMKKATDVFDDGADDDDDDDDE